MRAVRGGSGRIVIFSGDIPEEEEERITGAESAGDEGEDEDEADGEEEDEGEEEDDWGDDGEAEEEAMIGVPGVTTPMVMSRAIRPIRPIRPMMRLMMMVGATGVTTPVLRSLTASKAIRRMKKVTTGVIGATEVVLRRLTSSKIKKLTRRRRARKATTGEIGAMSGVSRTMAPAMTTMMRIVRYTMNPGQCSAVSEDIGFYTMPFDFVGDICNN